MGTYRLMFHLISTTYFTFVYIEYYIDAIVELDIYALQGICHAREHTWSVCRDVMMQ